MSDAQVKRVIWTTVIGGLIIQAVIGAIIGYGMLASVKTQAENNKDDIITITEKKADKEMVTHQYNELIKGMDEIKGEIRDLKK